MNLTETDSTFARWLRDMKVLADVQHSELDFSNGVIAVMCCDGDQMDDRYHFLSSALTQAGVGPRIHPITRHGGALRVAKESPLNKPGRTTDLDLIDEIQEAVELKKINTVLLEAHGPCGKAMAHGLSLEMTTHLHIEGKQRLRREIPGVTFATFYHLDWGNGQKRYYHFTKARFDAALQHRSPVGA